MAPALQSIYPMVRISLALLVFAAGCDLGEVPLPGGGSNMQSQVDAGMPPPGQTGIQAYTANVYTILEGKCAGCHTGANDQFCAADATSSYGKIIVLPTTIGTFDPATAPVLTKIAAGHNGTAYTPAEISAITAWLNIEKAARP